MTARPKQTAHSALSSDSCALLSGLIPPENLLLNLIIPNLLFMLKQFHMKPLLVACRLTFLVRRRNRYDFQHSSFLWLRNVTDFAAGQVTCHENGGPSNSHLN